MSEEYLFRKLLNDYRMGEGLSQEELAEKLGVDPKTVQNWEEGRGFPIPKNFRKLMDVFKLNKEERIAFQNAHKEAKQKSPPSDPSASPQEPPTSDQPTDENEHTEPSNWLNDRPTSPVPPVGHRPIRQFITSRKRWVVIVSSCMAIVLIGSTVIFTGNFTNNFRNNKIYVALLSIVNLAPPPTKTVRTLVPPPTRAHLTDPTSSPTASPTATPNFGTNPNPTVAPTVAPTATPMLGCNDGTGDLICNGGFELERADWVDDQDKTFFEALPGLGGVSPYEGQIDAWLSAPTYGLGIYNETNLSIAQGDGFCVRAELQAANSGVYADISLSLQGKNTDDVFHYTFNFNKVPTGHWTKIVLCARANNGSHTSLRIDIYPPADNLSLFVDDVYVYKQPLNTSPPAQQGPQ